jgi:hypothetical protein
MKRFSGLVLVAAGLIVSGWGGYYALSGSLDAVMRPLPVSAMTGGLIGLALLTVGLIWVRD